MTVNVLLFNVTRLEREYLFPYTNSSEVLASKIGTIIYHSNEQPVGVAGMAEIVKEAYPDPSQFDKKSEYYDATATKENPRWVCPDVKFVEKFKRIVTLQELRSDPKLSGLMLLKKGSRLSVIPVAPDEFRRIVKLANG
jgi:predicted RNA-binding protein with PUA-like domain